MTTKKITVKVGTSKMVDGKLQDVDIERDSSVTIPESAEDVLELLGEDAKGADDKAKSRVVRAIVYAFDLWERAKVSAQIRSENVDPTKTGDKAFEAFNKNRIALGKKPLTREAFDALD